MDRIAPIILLRLRLTSRGTGRTRDVVSAVMMLVLFVGPLGIAGGVFTSAGLDRLVGRQRGELLHFILDAVWFFWLFFPLVGFSLNQAADLTRLFIFPVRRARIFLGNTLGCIVDPTTLIVIPAFAAIAHRLASSVSAGVVVALTLVLFMVHTVALSQAFLLALLGILRSRRLRDWVVLSAPLIGVFLYLAPQVIVRRDSLFQIVVGWRPSRYLGLTPPGVAAHAIDAAEHGRYLQAAPYLAGCLAYTAVAVALGSWVLGRLHAGVTGGGSGGGTGTAGGDRVPLLGRFATTPLAAMAVKEVRYYWRDPHHQMMFILPLLVLALMLGRLQSAGIRVPPVVGVSVVSALMLTTSRHLFCNVFGIDREGLRLLFATPCRRDRILMGKNLAAVAVATVTGCIAALSTGIALKAMDVAVMVPPLILSGALIFAAVGNVVSVFFPMRAARRGQNPFTSSSGKGCLSALVVLLALTLTALAGVPVILGGILPYAAHKPSGFILAIPAAVVYSAGFYGILLKFVATPALLQRETEILEECLAGDPA